MIIVTVLILLAVAAWLLRALVQGILGLKWTILVTSIHNDSWEVSTRWYDRRAGSWRGIVTTVNESDGVVSRLGGGKPYYHSKQPMQSLESMKKYHMLARKRFFARMQCEYVREWINAARLSWTPPGHAEVVPLWVDLSAAPQLVVSTWVGLTLLACLSAWLPARRAANLEIVDALRHV